MFQQIDLVELPKTGPNKKPSLMMCVCGWRGLGLQNFHTQDGWFLLPHGFPYLSIKDSFITQDRNDDFEGGQVESTFS